MGTQIWVEKMPQLQTPHHHPELPCFLGLSANVLWLFLCSADINLAKSLARVTLHLRAAPVASTAVVKEAPLPMRLPVCLWSVHFPPVFSLACGPFPPPPSRVTYALALVCLAGPSTILGCWISPKPQT